MIDTRFVPAVLCGGALATSAFADLTIDVGRLNNIHPTPNISYAGDWGHCVSSGEDQGYTVIDVDIAAIMAESGERYLHSVRIRDHGTNSYGPLSPGADIDLVEFIGLASHVEVGAFYDGPTATHAAESSAELMTRLDHLDAFTGANEQDDDVYVSLGRQGELELIFSGGDGHGGDGGGDGGSDDGGGTGIDPFGADGIAGTGLVLRIAEAGSMERFTIHLETSSIPAPAVAPLLGGLLFGARRRRR